jgi:hypothetical protein
MNLFRKLVGNAKGLRVPLQDGQRVHKQARRQACRPHACVANSGS